MNATDIVAAAIPTDDLPDTEIDAIIADLRGLHRKAALEFALAVGRVVLDRMFRGDLGVWRSRGEKSGSFRKLAAKLDPMGIPGLSSPSLSRAVAMVELDARVGVAGRPQLLAGHAMAVLGLAPAQQERLLGEAEANDWSPTALKAEAARVRKAEAADAERLTAAVEEMRVRCVGLLRVLRAG